MRSKIFLWILALLCGLALVGPVEAVTIGGVDYALYARCKIGLEQGGTVIDGNVRVAQICGAQQGFLQIGAGTTINGNASANRIFFGTNAKVTGTPPACVFNISAGGLFSVVCPGSAPGVPPFVADTLASASCSGGCPGHNGRGLLGRPWPWRLQGHHCS